MSPFWLRRIALAFASILLALVVCEGFLRLFWCGPARETYEFQSSPFLYANPYWGVWHLPNHSVEHRKSCFDAHYRTNEFGMKSDPLRSDRPRIALLGDSFVEGFGNDNETTMQRFMAAALDPDYEVLNFGVSGHFTTIDELVLYDDFARFFHPRVVLLFFLNYNDLRDSLEPAKRGLIDDDLNFVYPKARALEEVVSSFPKPPPEPPDDTAEQRLCLSRLWRFAERVFRDQVQMKFDILWDIHLESAKPYLPDEDAETKKAWAIVETSLTKLAEITQREGSTLVVVQVADPYQIDKNWLQVTSAWIRRPLDPTHPNRRLEEICKKHRIRRYDMYEDVVRTIEQRNLHFPYLSFRCDRHYSPEGQKLMADLVVRYLREHALVEARASAGEGEGRAESGPSDPHPPRRSFAVTP